MPKSEFDLAVDKIMRWSAHPPVMVRELFDATPDAWQDDALEAYPSTKRVAMKACAGPGKTTVLAWIGWNFLLTRPHPHIGAASITGENLKTGLWTELAYWRNKSPLLQAKFEMTNREIFAREHPKTWKLEARTWAKDANPEQIGQALAGLHAEYVMWLLDESGGYPDAILPVIELIFAGNPKEAHVIQAGNPTQRSGPLYRACSAATALWKVIEITGDPEDPKRSPRIALDYAKAQIAQYGRDNPWVMVRILGQFPPSSLNALIGDQEVAEAMHRYWRTHEIGDAPRIMGVDVASMGEDASVICKRQGIQVFPFLVRRNINSTQGAGWVAREWQDWNADACFIDATGGFGSGWIDNLHLIGRAPIGVQYAANAHQNTRFVNKRAEMYFEAVEWIRRGGALPECPELAAALTQTTYTFRGDRFLLEPKEDVKAKIGYSPDHCDAFVETFAEPVSIQVRGVRPKFSAEYNPLQAFAENVSHMTSDYDPLKG